MFHIYFYLGFHATHSHSGFGSKRYRLLVSWVEYVNKLCIIRPWRAVKESWNKWYKSVIYPHVQSSPMKKYKNKQTNKTSNKNNQYEAKKLCSTSGVGGILLQEEDSKLPLNPSIYRPKSTKFLTGRPKRHRFIESLKNKKPKTHMLNSSKRAGR